MTDTTTERPLRMCDTCGGVDDHPRHVFAHTPGEGRTSSDVAAAALAATPSDRVAAILDQIRDESTTMRHMDCCRDAGCPDGTCGRVTSGAEDQRGAALVAHLTENGTRA